MRPIVQTPLGRVACWLGFHALVLGGVWRDESGNVRSTSGGCVRCNAGWGWDS